MEFEPAEYCRRPFNVKAEEVTYENIEAVATWCKGRVDSEGTKVLGGGEIKLPVIKFPGQGEDRGKELVARLGYFVVYSKGRFRVYKAPQFHAAFEKKPVEISAVGQQPEEEVWIEPGDTTDQIAGKLGFKPVDPDDAFEAAQADQERDDALHNAGQL